MLLSLVEEGGKGGISFDGTMMFVGLNNEE